jgi:hypothetical protein
MYFTLLSFGRPHHHWAYRSRVSCGPTAREGQIWRRELFGKKLYSPPRSPTRVGTIHTVEYPCLSRCTTGFVGSAVFGTLAAALPS